MRIRFRNSGTATQYRIDDIVLSGLPTCSASIVSGGGPLSSLSTTYGTPSSPTSFTLAGSSLGATISIAALSGFEFATTGGYSSTLSDISATGPTTINIRLAATANAGTHSGTIVCTSGSTTLNVPMAESIVNKATPTLSISNTPTTYNGSSQTATVSGTGDGTVSNIQYDASSTAPTNAGTYAISADIASSDNYIAVTGVAVGDFVINKATPTLSVTNTPVTYTGSELAATVNASVDGTISSVLTGGAATQTAAGTYAVTANFVPTDTTNYSSLSAASAGNFVIDKAASSVIVSGTAPFSYTYNGSGQAPSFTASGSNATITYLYSGTGIIGTTSSTPINVGTYSVTASVAANGNYAAASSSATSFSITAAASSVTVSGTAPFSYTYNGLGQAPSFTASGSNATITYLYSGTGIIGTTSSTPINVGTYSVTASVAANGNYAAASSSATSFSITAAASSVTVTGSAPFSYTYNGLAQSPSFTASGSTATITYLYSGTGIIGTTSITPINAGTYSVTASVAANGNYGSASSSATAFTIGVGTTTWTSASGGSWSNNAPNLSLNAIISYDYNFAGLTANTLTVNNNAVVVIPSGYNVTLNGALTVSSGSFTLNNNTNLIQTDASAENTGNIIVKRESAKIVRLDHTLWSSPVTGQNLRGFSPLTVPYRFYTYETASNQYDATTITDATVFTPAKGFAIRAPNNYQTSPAVEWTGTFTGVPNNGTKTFPLVYASGAANINLVGNPYPSAIDAATFCSVNQSVINGTLYFYQHTLTMNSSGLFGTGTNYGTWTSGGSTKASVGVNADVSVFPSGTIEVGQGFMVKSTNTGNVTFNNDMRVASATHQFMKSSSTVTTLEKHRMWLNLESATGSDLNQILVGYVAGATEGVDDGYDGLAFGGTGSSLYSPIDARNYVIQCRSLPFNNTDEVPLGFNCTEAGVYTIKLSSVDGLFEGNQDVFIRDNLNGTDTNIKVAPFTFTSDIGTFDNRFKIVYTQALGVPSSTFNENSVIVYKNTDWFHVSTKGISMKDILVYDVSGRLIYKLNDLNNATAVLKGLTTTKQVLFLKITSTENQSVTIKVLN